MPWLPNFGLGLWPKGSAPEKYKAAQEGHGERSFLVRYVLEDPVTRRIEDSQIALEENVQRNVAGPDAVDIPVQFERNDQSRLAGIAFRPHAVSATHAIAATYPKVMARAASGRRL